MLRWLKGEHAESPAGRNPAAGGRIPADVRPGDDRLGVVRPGVDRPGVDRPEVVRPGVVRPEVVRPGVVRPEVVRPGVVRSEVVLTRLEAFLERLTDRPSPWGSASGYGISGTGSGGLLAPDVAGLLSPEDPLEAMARRIDAEVPRADPATRLMTFYCRAYLGGDLLPKSDLAGMAVGLEVRAPFLDPDVVAFAWSLPPALRYRLGRTKVVLRHLARPLLPPGVAERPKKGFGMAVGRFVLGPLRALAEDLLSERALAAGGLLHPAPVRRMLEAHLSGRANLRKPLWTLMAFQIWARAQGLVSI